SSLELVHRAIDRRADPPCEQDEVDGAEQRAEHDRDRELRGAEQGDRGRGCGATEAGEAHGVDDQHAAPNGFAVALSHRRSPRAWPDAPAANAPPASARLRRARRPRARPSRAETAWTCAPTP